jgi:hypothetical protein
VLGRAAEGATASEVACRGLVAVAVGGGLQPLGLVEVSLDENPIPFLKGWPRRSDVMFSL